MNAHRYWLTFLLLAGSSTGADQKLTILSKEKAAKLPNGKTAAITFDPNLSKGLTTRVTETPGVSADAKNRAEAQMQKIVAALKQDPTALNALEPTWKTVGNEVQIVDVSAPSFKIASQASRIFNPAQRGTLVNYNSSYLLALTNSAQQEVKDLSSKFRIESDVLRRTVGRTLAKADAQKGAAGEKEFFEALSLAAKLKIEREEVDRRLQDKVSYGAEDVFLPENYEHILNNLPRVIAFHAPGRLNLIGVGVLIGPSLALTCKHVVDDTRFAQATGRARSKGNLAQVDCTYDIVRVVLDAKTEGIAADLALVHVKQTAGSGFAIAGPLVIESAPPRNHPIYVLAMHRADVESVAVYDSAAVLFPASIKGQNLGILYSDVILSLGVRVIAKELSVEKAVELRKELEESYGSTVAAAVPSTDYFYQRAYPGGVRHRVFGFGTDTIGGNSGGGVFSKNTGNLIGLISAGAPGTGTERSADWWKHEMGVPGEMIKALLERYLSLSAQNTSLPQANVKL
jgi:cell division septum initiation protein DivIVA